MYYRDTVEKQQKEREKRIQIPHIFGKFMNKGCEKNCILLNHQQY